MFSSHYYSKINFIVLTKQFKNWNLPRANCKKEMEDQIGVKGHRGMQDTGSDLGDGKGWDGGAYLQS